MSDETNNVPVPQNRPRTKEEILGILKGDAVPPPTEQRAADAVTPAPQSGEVATPVALPVWTADQVREVLRGVYDPEIHMNIIDLGLVYGIDVKETAVHVRMSLTSPGCPYGPYLIHQVKETVQSLKGITSADVEVVWDPPWGPMMMTEEARLELGFDV